MYSQKTTTTTTTSSSVGQPMTRTTVTQQSSGMPEMYMASGVAPVGMVRQQFTSYGGVPTTYVSGTGMMPTMMTPSLMPPIGTGGAHTTLSTFPGFVQTPMIHGTGGYTTRTVSTQPYMTSGWRPLNSWMGGFNGMSVMAVGQPSGLVSAPMSLLGSPTNMQAAARQTSGSTFSSSSSLNINGVHCEGLLEMNGTEVVRAKNLFIGDAPFHLSADFLTLSPEHVVMANDPHIKCHVADVPNQACRSLNMEQMRSMLKGATEHHHKEAAAADPTFKAPEVKIENIQVHIGLPGQNSAMLAVDANGQLHMTQ